ncbi:MAG: hypothetical protein ACSHWW_05450 [Nonlabens sp.]|uniref:hypothetical protein n=1 Tax=Nonlabens sp. TaxID=1888209 RepID=UPI003EFAB83A
MSKMFSKLKFFFFGSRNSKIELDFLFNDFLNLTKQKRIILSIATNNKLLIQIERVQQAHEWKNLIDLSSYGDNDYLFYFIKDIDTYEQENMLQNLPLDFNVIEEKVDETNVFTYTKIINVKAAAHLGLLLDELISMVYNDSITKQPKDISLFEVIDEVRNDSE